MVRRFSCCRRRGVSRVAGSRKVYGPGRRRLEHAELPGLHLGITPDLGQVAAHQREVMMPVGCADAPDAVQRILVADVAAERVAGIRRIDDQRRRRARSPPRAGSGAAADSRDEARSTGSRRCFRRGTALRAAIIRAPPGPPCRTVIEFAPWIVFGLVYKFGGGLYPATAALMVAMALLLAYDWLRERQHPADAPAAGRPRVGVRHRHAGAARRALPAVEGLGVLLDRRARVRRLGLHRQAKPARATARQAACRKELQPAARAPGAPVRCSWARSTWRSAWSTSGWR